MFIHMFFVNVQSCSVLNACYLWIRYSVIQSCFLLTTPRISCRHIFSWFSSLALPSLLESTPLSYCSASTASWNVATRPLSVFSLYRRFRRFDIKLWPLCSPDSRTSLRLLARFTAASWPSFTIDYSTAYLRSTHCPVRAIVASQHRHHPHHRPSCILRAPHPSETHACRSPTTPSRSSLPPSALQPRLHGASHLKDSEHHHRVEHHFTPPTRSESSSASSPARERPFPPLPSHRPSTFYASLSSAAIAGHSRAR